MEMTKKDTDLNESSLDSRMSDKQAESTIEESFHEEKAETNESETKTKPSLLDSIVQSCKAYINNLLTNLRHDNRSLVTGLAVVSAISCFLTASFAYFTQNHPTSQNTYLYDQSPSNTADFYYQYSIEPYGNYPQPFYFESNSYPTIIDEIQNIFDELFGESSHHFFQSSNESNFPNSKLQEF
ncbi:hypothetical protein J0J70_03835 [Turicibacter bilis]|uniref:Uncharacterized protein n=1 Tax=Turicibacter bilis TaxID=2735723 RepID=A0A9Q9FFY9_9FIRM|nr:hypothetical protein [Turicibacter bilis]MBS3197254.1 hypothetical protein [Turicibacter bilis]MBS3200051.1 hypothetical protein [Turicibacter bilis]UUF05416.1 hypothetical protein J0J69_10050 [Turicibacter bilis]UUF09132.1 hypothetical protein J0J70_03835 [Turicibacter bilis]